MESRVAVFAGSSPVSQGVARRTRAALTTSPDRGTSPRARRGRSSCIELREERIRSRDAHAPEASWLATLSTRLCSGDARNLGRLGGSAAHEKPLDHQEGLQEGLRPSESGADGLVLPHRCVAIDDRGSTRGFRLQVELEPRSIGRAASSKEIWCSAALRFSLVEAVVSTRGARRSRPPSIGPECRMSWNRIRRATARLSCGRKNDQVI